MKMTRLFVQSSQRKLFILLLCDMYSYHIVQSKNCVQNDPCSCTFDDGSGMMDLSKLGHSSGDPLIQDEPASDGFLYSFNPCYPFKEGTCEKAAACQFDIEDSLYFNIGDATKVTFSYNGENVIGSYLSDDDESTSKVTFICDPTADPPKFVVNGTKPKHESIIDFTIISKEVCPKSGPSTGSTYIPIHTDGPSGTANTEASLSTGWILVIVLLSVVLVYIVAGVTFNKFYRTRSGREVIPNVTFWSTLPGLIKDGFGFTYSKILRREHQKYASI